MPSAAETEAVIPRFGSVQGRLVPSPPGELQWFPQARWKDEFALAREVGIDFIELIAERRDNPDNPLWSEDGIAMLLTLARETGRILHAFCTDYIIDHDLRVGREVVEHTVRLIGQGGRLGMKKLVLPLFEHSELTPDNAGSFIGCLRDLADAARAHGIELCLETILTGTELLDVLEALGHDAVSVVYDTGNRVAFGHDLPGDIRLLGSRIRHVHVKDKNSANQNVLLGTGLVDFKAVFEALRDIGYRGPYTFESQRGHDPLRTARYNMTVVDFFAAEAADHAS